MVTSVELAELLADIRALHDELSAIQRDTNPLARFKKRDEIQWLESLLHEKFVQLSSICAPGKTYHYGEQE